MFPTEAVPDRIGAYKVIRRLSAPGSADVYLGRMEGPMGFRRVCALKLVQNSIEGDVRRAEEVGREAAICSRLNHPAILRMFDFFEFDKKLVLVLEHVEGADLDRLLSHLSRRKQKLSDDAIWHIAHELVGALSHAHAAVDEDGSQAPIVHRNLCPENILIGWDGQVHLAGFGLGKILGRSPDTVVGVVKGTPGFMAPEQLRGERVTPRADVYGVAALLWSLLAGKDPPKDGTRPESISKLRPDIPREIAAAIEAALEASPDRRKITCAELQTWLEKITKVDIGRDELREKILRLRAVRSTVGDVSEPTHGIRPTAKAARRKLSIRGFQAQPADHAVKTTQSSRAPGRGDSSFPLSEAPPSSRGWAGRYDVRAPVPPLPDIPDDSPYSEAPPSFAPPVLAPMSVAPPGLASQAPPSIATRRPGPMASVAPAAALPVAPVGLPPVPEVPPPFTFSPQSAANPLSTTQSSPTPSTMAADQPPPPALEPRPAFFAPPTRTDVDVPDARRRPTLTPHHAPLSRWQSVAIAALTASVIVFTGVFVAERSYRAGASGPSVASGSASAPAPSKPSAEPRAAAPAQPPPPPPPPAPTPVAPAPPPAPTRLDPLSLPGGFGYLTVDTTATQASVFLNGRMIGPVGEPVKALCGKKFIRIGTAPDHYGAVPAWIAPGRTVVIPCQGAVQVSIKPAPSRR